MHIVVDHPCNESTYEALSRLGFPPDMTKNIFLQVCDEKDFKKEIMIAYRKRERKKSSSRLNIFKIKIFSKIKTVSSHERSISSLYMQINILHSR